MHALQAPDLEQFRRHYAILEIPEFAPAEDVREAYRDLVAIWHPDRFASSERLCARMESKLKDINAAYESISRAGFPAAPGVVLARPMPPGSARGSSARGRHRHSAVWRSATNLAAIALVCWAVGGNAAEQCRPALSRIAGALASLVPEGSASASAARRLVPAPAPHSAKSPAARAAPATPAAYFSPGDTRKRVFNVQGAPASVRGRSWFYLQSEVVFDSAGRVAAYGNFSRNLNVRVRPRSQKSRTPGVFGVGSTVDEVLLAQGTPTSLYGSTWLFRYSVVKFRGGRVVAYDNFGRNLRVR